MTKAQLRAALAQFGLENETDSLSPFTSLEIALVSTKPKKAKATKLARTRIGGAPLVPAKGFEWPAHRWPLREIKSWPDFARDEVHAARAKGQVHNVGDELVMPLSFIAQIDLSEVAEIAKGVEKAKALPNHGLLLFFASIMTNVADPLFAKRVASTARWVDDAKSDLVPMEQPATPDPFPASVIELQPEARLSCTLSFEDRKALSSRYGAKLVKRFNEEVCQIQDVLLPPQTHECAGPMPPPKEVALIRIVEHDEIGLYIGDASWLTFSIPEKSLRARRFDAARASVFIG